MTKQQKTTTRYSDCFKLQVVEEIEKNGLSIEEDNEILKFEILNLKKRHFYEAVLHIFNIFAASFDSLKY